jgi:hypothetical protein
MSCNAILQVLIELSQKFSTLNSDMISLTTKMEDSSLSLKGSLSGKSEWNEKGLSFIIMQIFRLSSVTLIHGEIGKYKLLALVEILTPSRLISNWKVTKIKSKITQHPQPVKDCTSCKILQVDAWRQEPEAQISAAEFEVITTGQTPSPCCATT